VLDMSEVARRTEEAWRRGATEVCLQGGIHPAFTGQTYLEVLHAVKEAAPDMHVHAFSPLEVTQGAKTLGIPLENFLRQLKAPVSAPCLARLPRFSTTRCDGRSARTR
jgi:FO synthase